MSLDETGMQIARAATAAAEAAAETARSFGSLSTQLDSKTERIFHELKEVNQSVAGLSKDFAVHLVQDKPLADRVAKLEKWRDGNGVTGAAEQLKTLWAVDQIKIWAVRLFVGSALSVTGFLLGYGIKHWLGW
jgi:hypothetical protein